MPAAGRLEGEPPGVKNCASRFPATSENREVKHHRTGHRHLLPPTTPIGARIPLTGKPSQSIVARPTRPLPARIAWQKSQAVSIVNHKGAAVLNPAHQEREEAYVEKTDPCVRG